MMAEKTKNYGFSTPGLDGAANITVQDENWTALDEKLKEELDKKVNLKQPGGYVIFNCGSATEVI